MGRHKTTAGDHYKALTLSAMPNTIKLQLCAVTTEHCIQCVHYLDVDYSINIHIQSLRAVIIISSTSSNYYMIPVST